ncbi:hypothetical protein [Polymorphobacter megasporae]|uniref:hypothetical protein n=1 Tax=Glacieibacterium megasporae TaxID=2835787 RepID=UPI001C1E70F3|nr:hypothetical protein [Polymorphobacter megasporae]UAJ12488.1 hypothetical protein KTC28_22050 [Polymorphobacter megasporae]
MEDMMFIRANTAIANVDYDNISYDDLVELSFDRVQQLRRDGRDDAVEDAAWHAMLSRKRRETYAQA